MQHGGFTGNEPVRWLTRLTNNCEVGPIIYHYFLAIGYGATYHGCVDLTKRRSTWEKIVVVVLLILDQISSIMNWNTFRLGLGLFGKPIKRERERKKKRLCFKRIQWEFKRWIQLESVVELFAVVIVFAIFAIDLVSTLAELISAEESQEKVAHIFLFEIRGSHDSNERKVKVVCTTSTQKSPPERTHPRSIICFIRRKAVRVLDSKVNGYCDLPESLVTQVWMQQISTIFFLSRCQNQCQNRIGVECAENMMNCSWSSNSNWSSARCWLEANRRRKKRSSHTEKWLLCNETGWEIELLSRKRRKGQFSVKRGRRQGEWNCKWIFFCWHFGYFGYKNGRSTLCIG